MSTQGVTITGSTLSLLKAGEKGVVSRIANIDQTIAQNLQTMGILPGVSITLEQRSPNYLIRVGDAQFTVAKDTAKAVYVRLSTPASPPKLQLFNWFATTNS